VSPKTKERENLRSRTDAIIPKADRDTNPLICNGDTFTTPDVPESGVYLN
jgi:hypothetical protein